MQLYAHQQTILDLLHRYRRFAVFAEQGTGKTLPMLLHILRLLKGGEIKDALIICPKAVYGSWERDIDKFFGAYDKAILRKRVTITTYDLIWRRPELDKPWGLMCLDESHYIKNRTSNRNMGAMRTVNGKRKRVSHGISQIGQGATYRYIMTGTPIGNSHWEEIWAQYHFLDPAIFGKYADFEKRYCVLNQFYKPWKYLNVDELKERIFAHAYRITKRECLDLPDKLPPERYQLENKEKALYREMLQNFIAELDIEAKNPLARMVKLRQMCSGFVMGDDSQTHRLKCEKQSTLSEFLDGWDKKLVIFAEFRQSMNDIAQTLKKRKLPFLVLDGAQKDKTIWKHFQEGDQVRVIVCQYRTASAGIDLYAADTILFYEPTLSSQIFEQACDRIHRVGQSNKCSYILFETKGTVESKIWDALMRHRDFNETELAGYVQEVRK